MYGRDGGWSLMSHGKKLRKYPESPIPLKGIYLKL